MDSITRYTFGMDRSPILMILFWIIVYYYYSKDFNEFYGERGLRTIYVFIYCYSVTPLFHEDDPFRSIDQCTVGSLMKDTQNDFKYANVWLL